MTKKARRCVFCGDQPSGKNVGQILPKWLLRMTGDPSEPVPLGVNRSNGKPRLFPFSQLVLPSCRSCDEKYGDLEEKARLAFQKICKRTQPSEDELNSLLDWFDKVRVGLWHWQMRIDPPSVGFEPKFYINDRVGRKDRLVFVVTLEDDIRGLGFYGTDTMAFIRSPSTFVLASNNTAFINVSFDYLLSKRLGFPYLKQWDAIAPGFPDFGLLINGTGQVHPPILPGRLRLQGVSFGQCIFDPEIDEINGTEYYSNEIINPLVSDINGRSIIFIGRGDFVSKLSELDAAALHPNMPVARRETYKAWLLLKVHKIQSDIVHLWPGTNLVGEEMKALIENEKEETLSELSHRIETMEEVYRALGGIVV